MFFHDFRDLLRVIDVPSLLVISYFWLVPESVRWLLVTGRVDRAIRTLEGTAAANGRLLSDKAIELLKSQYSPTKQNELTNKQSAAEHQSFTQSFCLIVKSKKLLLRLFCVCITWVICSHSAYGLSQISTHINGKNRYLSFILVGAVDIPGNFISVPLLNRFKRRPLGFVQICYTLRSLLHH